MTATTRSNVEKFWNNEIGEYASIRVCRSNMAPWFTGTAAPTGTPGSSGTLATGNYYIVVTGLDVKSGFERLVSQTSAPIGVTGPTGSISVTLPSNVGYVYNVYIGTSPATISNFATSPQGPLQGTYAGQATQLPGGTTVTLSGIGMANMVPPVAPAVGITVFQTFIYGYEAVTTSSLMNLEIIKTQGADKSDPLNQIAAIVGFKFLEGTVVTQPSFLAIAESVGTVVGPG